MWALQESRFAVILWVIATIVLLGYFVTQQNTMKYTNFKDNLTQNFSSLQARNSVKSTKTIRDVLTVDGKNLKGTSANQMFWGLTLSWTVDSQVMFDNYVPGTTTNIAWIIKAPAGKYTITILSADTTAVIPDINVVPNTWSGLSTLSSITSTDYLSRGWNLNNKGYIAYSFQDAATAKSMMDKYLVEGTLVHNKVWTTAADLTIVIVPFQG